MSESVDVTGLLADAARGDESAERRLAEHLFGELHALARSQMGAGPAHTLQPTALVHEAWMRARNVRGEASFAGRSQFFAFAARAMRSVLVDHARRRAAEKRGGGARREPLDVVLDLHAEGGVDVVALSDALERLAEEDPELERVVVLRFFGGLTMPETAAALGVSLSTAERHWRLARMWLRRELEA